MRSNTNLIEAKLFLILLLFVVSMDCVGQQDLETISGAVIDLKTDQPIPYATIRFADYSLGTISNLDGEFQLKCPSDYFLNEPVTVVCSSVGYGSRQIILANNGKIGIIIKLAPSSILLDEVTIYSDSETEIELSKLVKNAIKEFKETCPSHNAQTTLRNTIFENGKCRKYLEAKINIFDPKGFGNSLRSQTSIGNNIKIISKRESFDFSSSLILFDNHVNNLLEFMFKNSLKYKFRGKGYEFIMEDTLYIPTGEVYVINAFQRKDTIDHSIGMKKKYDMKFYVARNPRDIRIFNIVKFQLIQNRSFKTSVYKFQENSIFEIEMKRQGTYFAPSVIENTIVQKTSYSYGELDEREIVSHHILEFDTVNFDEQNNFSNLTSNFKYNESFWSANPIPNNIRTDLSDIIPLTDQFDSYSNFGKRISLQDSINYLKWQSYLNEHENIQNVYYVLWDNQKIFFQDLVYESLMDWIMSHKNSEIIFIGVMTDWGLWAGTSSSILNYSFFKHFYMPVSWTKTKFYDCHNSVPAYLVINKNNDIKCQYTPFSSEYLMNME